MNVTLKGTVVKLGELQSFNDGSFQKKEIVVKIDEDSQYPQEVPVEFINKNISIVDPVGVGDTVEVDCNIRGSAYNDRHFVSLPGWRLVVVNKGEGGGDGLGF